MAKRKTVEIKQSDALQEIDDALDEALDNLKGANGNVAEVLEIIDGKHEAPPEEGEPAAEGETAAAKNTAVDTLQETEAPTADPQ
jgi:hypothetical protein